MIRTLSGWASLTAALALAACAPAATTAETAPANASAPAYAEFDLGPPYIGGPLPGGQALVGAPPAEGSPELARDRVASAAGLALQGSARWNLAARDADLSTGAVPRTFSCAAGLAISDAQTPAIAHLLRRAAGDFAMSTSGVKAIYQRPRPFMGNGAPTCDPDSEEALRTNGSYPSGHSAIGYGTGLVLAAVLPDRAAALVTRGREFGESRRVCNVHWLSDIEAGRTVAAATFARLQSNPAFREDLRAAQAEAARMAGNRSAGGCDVETGALATS
ncbi:phosphatase PAP2 family protein [Pelagerythrobacter sp.]|uniref:acid phosphatase n=1 Tax=Pelagerythrobacter sp. TaxID=2800702 RepID=UPI0035AEA34E